MHALVQSIKILAAFASCVRAGIPGYTQVGTFTRLLGSSFGVPGVNLTFDYVVSSPHPRLSSKPSLTLTA